MNHYTKTQCEREKKYTDRSTQTNMNIAASTHARYTHHSSRGAAFAVAAGGIIS